jgi:hypothetical protein
MPTTEEQKSNLVTQAQRTPEERKRIARMGAEAANKKKREKKTLRELLEVALSTRVTNKDGDTKTRKEVAMLMLADKMVRGDLKAIALAQSILGETQPERLEVTGKDGAELIPARRLTKEEAQELLRDLEKEY